MTDWDPATSVGLAKLLSDGTIALGLFNFNENGRKMQILCESLGYPYASGYDLKARDIFTGEEQLLTREMMLEDVAPYGCRMFILTPVKRA